MRSHNIWTNASPTDIFLDLITYIHLFQMVDVWFYKYTFWIRFRAIVLFENTVWMKQNRPVVLFQARYRIKGMRMRESKADCGKLLSQKTSARQTQIDIKMQYYIWFNLKFTIDNVFSFNSMFRKKFHKYIAHVISKSIYWYLYSSTDTSTWRRLCGSKNLKQ